MVGLELLCNLLRCTLGVGIAGSEVTISAFEDCSDDDREAVTNMLYIIAESEFRWFQNIGTLASFQNTEMRPPWALASS
jgi:hypothetical protein